MHSFIFQTIIFSTCGESYFKLKLLKSLKRSAIKNRGKVMLRFLYSSNQNRNPPKLNVNEIFSKLKPKRVPESTVVAGI